MSTLFPSAKHFLSRDLHTHSFGGDIPPVLSVSVGEQIHIQTWDCYKGAVSTEADLIKPIDDSLINPATGPIYVEGAEAGDTLTVEILDIKTSNRGVARFFPDEGQLHEKVYGPYGKFLTVTDEIIYLTKSISFPLNPMLGVIGVAPESGSILTMPAGKHGGNLDNNANKIGSKIYLPVKHPGALLAIGDMHASMGDGEICGTGVEIGGDVLIKVGLIKNISSDYPITETPTSWITHGVAVEDIQGAMKIACEEAANLLVNHWNFTYEDAFIFLSVACDLGIAQNVHPCKGTVIAKLTIPKISACPAPFSAN
jgi:amidase